MDQNLELHPAAIDLPTFRHLLSQYDSTVKRIAAFKALRKPSSKGKSQRDKKAKTKKRSANGKDEGNEGEDGNEDGEKELDADAKNLVSEGVRNYQDLDHWRYGVLPGLIAERREEGKEKDLCLSKDEAIKLVEWKLKHGLNRPSLLGLLRSNKESVVQSATRVAFTSLPSSNSSPKDTKTEEYFTLQKTLEKLTTPLRGIGPATASLILSAASPESVPFYSDDTYLWLCLGIYPGYDPSSPWMFIEDEEKEEAKFNQPKPAIQEKEKEKVERNINDKRRPKHERDAAKRAKQVRPNGELNVKYDFPEYRRVWGAVNRLRGRLNEEARELDAGEGQEVSCVDIEKVALVIRHLLGGKAALVVEKREKKKGVKRREDEDADGDFAGMDEGRKRMKRMRRNN
ncbi:hypothetical protein BDV06DRAFT_152731 [Aspergillus oleicola]